MRKKQDRSGGILLQCVGAASVRENRLDCQSPLIAAVAGGAEGVDVAGEEVAAGCCAAGLVETLVRSWVGHFEGFERKMMAYLSLRE